MVCGVGVRDLRTMSESITVGEDIWVIHDWNRASIGLYRDVWIATIA